MQKEADYEKRIIDLAASDAPPAELALTHYTCANRRPYLVPVRRLPFRPIDPQTRPIYS